MGFTKRQRICEVSVILLVLTLACEGCFTALSEPAPAPPVYGKRETTRGFLTGTQSEGEGYGLYSYLLFGSAPSAADRERYLMTIQAYLETLNPTSDMEEYFPRWQLNVTYLPLTDTPPPEVSAGRDAKAATWLLDHYNYARARALLNKLPGEQRMGPYIISYPERLSAVAKIEKPILFQDLSKAQAKLSRTWMDAFLQQASKEHYWEPDLSGFTTRLRNSVSAAAEGLGITAEGFAKFIKVFEPVMGRG